MNMWLLPNAGYKHHLIWAGAAEASLVDFVRVAGSSGTIEVQQQRRRGLCCRAMTAVEGPLFLLVCGSKKTKKHLKRAIEMPNSEEWPSAGYPLAALVSFFLA
jgi:hypothetical protein